MTEGKDTEMYAGEEWGGGAVFDVEICFLFTLSAASPQTFHRRCVPTLLYYKMKYDCFINLFCTYIDLLVYLSECLFI